MICRHGLQKKSVPGFDRKGLHDMIPPNSALMQISPRLLDLVNVKEMLELMTCL